LDVYAGTRPADSVLFSSSRKTTNAAFSRCGLLVTLGGVGEHYRFGFMGRGGNGGLLKGVTAKEAELAQRPAFLDQEPKCYKSRRALSQKIPRK
jgi:hypothetical protein